MCKFCEKCFKSKKELMKHNKDIHKENLSVCWNYENGTCYYNDCWFSHEEQKSNETTSLNASFVRVSSKRKMKY